MNVRGCELRDLPSVIPLHEQAFAGQLGVAVGRRYLRALVSWFLTAPDAVSLVAEADGQIAGYVFGAPDGFSASLTRRLLPQIAIGVATHLPAVVRHPSFRWQLRSRFTNLFLRREPRRAIFETTPPGCFALVGIGTSPAMRGRGVGRALVEGFCARVPGRQVILDVFRDNAPALSLYERCGFRRIAEEGRVVRMLREPSAAQAH